MKLKELYCSFCQKKTKPLKALVTYYCPMCGAIFMASQVECHTVCQQAKKTKTEQRQPV